jgi:hypothetical protein
MAVLIRDGIPHSLAEFYGEEFTTLGPTVRVVLSGACGWHSTASAVTVAGVPSGCGACRCACATADVQDRGSRQPHVLSRPGTAPLSLDPVWSGLFERSKRELPGELVSLALPRAV